MRYDDGERAPAGVLLERQVVQEALAHDAGLSVASYRRIERGLTNPGWTSVVAILDALGVPLSDLARELEKLR